MPSPARDAWRRLPWQRWLARGTLLGLSAATVFGLAVFAVTRDAVVARHPALAAWWWLYLALGACSLLALLALLSRLRNALFALTLLSAIVFLFEASVLGWGIHLARIPLSLLLAVWADRTLQAR